MKKDIIDNKYKTLYNKITLYLTSLLFLSADSDEQDFLESLIEENV